MNWLGTDDQGRDVIARLIYGFRISVLFGLILTIAVLDHRRRCRCRAGLFRRLDRSLFQRFIEIWTSVPTLYLLMILAAFIAPNFWILLAIMLLFSWTSLVGVVRAEFLRGRNFEYVRAARALGLSNAKIMFKHILPNAMVATLTFMPFIASASIVDPHLARLPRLRLAAGLALARRADGAGQEQFAALPGSASPASSSYRIMLSLLVFIGEAVRDALDPRKTFR